VNRESVPTDSFLPSKVGTFQNFVVDVEFLALRMPGRCLRCKEYVHAAEEKLALEGSSCHFECFTCAICNKALDSRTMCESTKAQEIYCRFCYKRYYCIPGYGFGPTKPALISVHPIRNKDEDELMDNDQDCCNSGKCATTPERIFVPRPPSRQGQAYARPIPVPHRQYSKQVPTPKRASDCGKLKQGRVSPTSRVSTYCLYHRGKVRSLSLTNSNLNFLIIYVNQLLIHNLDWL